MSLTKRVPIPPNGVDYRGKVVLAPMVRSGELPSRLTALEYGADLVWGPETIDQSLIGCTRRVNPRNSTIEYTRWSSNGGRSHGELAPKESVIYRLHPTREKGKLIFQLGTAKPELAVAAARLVAGDVAGIDVNSGCPKPFSTVGGMGAALLRDPDRLCAILRALVADVGTPFGIGISVKIRILDDEADTVALVRRLCETGITGLTVHCRTTPMRPRERALRHQLRAIVRTCHEAGVACVMNGDVEDREQALQLMEEFGADGAMIATAAEKNSSVFRSKDLGGPLNWKDVVPYYIRTAIEMENRYGNTKFLLAQLMPGKVLEARKVTRAKCYRECVKALEMEAELGDQALRLDKLLGIGEFKEARVPAKRERLTTGENGEEESQIGPSKKTKPADESESSAFATMPTTLISV